MQQLQLGVPAISDMNRGESRELAALAAESAAPNGFDEF
jgi:hypothetical protein